MTGKLELSSTEFRVRYCKRCSRCWEWGLARIRLRHYKDFPTYGVKRKTCSKCKENNNENHRNVRKVEAKYKIISR